MAATAAAGSSSSRFAVTCGLLRQYMMEQRHHQHPTTPTPTPPQVEEEEEQVADARTMQLFPPRRAATSSSQPAPAPGTAPLTIFYDGRVVVFDDVPAEKAVELMKLARSVCSPAPVANAAPPPTPQPVQPAAAAPPLPDMPIARKASLQRFLQKRKQRITASEPYKKAEVASPAPTPEKSFAAVMPVKDEPATWLGL